MLGKCWKKLVPYIVYFVPYSFEYIRENGSIICKNGHKSIADLCLCDKIATECFKENLKLSEIFKDINGTQYYDPNQKSASSLIKIQNDLFKYSAIFYIIIYSLLLIVLGFPFLIAVYSYRKSEYKMGKYKIRNYVLNVFFLFCIFYLEIRTLRLWYQRNFNFIIMVIFFIKLFIVIFNYFLYISLHKDIICKMDYMAPTKQNNNDNSDNSDNNNPDPDIKKVLVLFLSIIHTIVTLIFLIILFAMLHF